ncbi:hypothetical protein [Geothrix alkalitolerans]|uniref:hypothetical protein n=1 Tax=Geothrix alkalitolerans TaxID=2922724 RepID=UPI001FB02925|nr:hypothetical protein [Geothrix alkalitolerans]
MATPASLSAFAALPDEARLWLVAFDRPVDAALLAPDMDALMGRWRHKGVQYQGIWTLLEDRILAIAEPTLASNPSGCAIDGMLRSVGQAAGRLGLGLLDPQTVVARVSGHVRTFARTDLEAHLADGTLDAGTPILDLALLTLGDLRSGRFERPLAATWIGRKHLRTASAQA